MVDRNAKISVYHYKSRGVKYVQIAVRDDYLRPIFKGIMTEEQFNLMLGGEKADIEQDFTL